MSLRVRELPPLDLDVELTSADGTRRLLTGDADAPGDRPQNVQFATKRAEGFSTGGCVLPRRADRDWPDLGLYDGFALVGRQGETAFEGRFASTPRSINETHTITINAVGWIAATRDRRMSEVFVDRDLSVWGAPSVTRRATILTAGFKQGNDAAAIPDAINPGIRTGWQDSWPVKINSEAVYDAGTGLKIAKLFYSWMQFAEVDPADTNYDWGVRISNDETFAGGDSSGNLRAAGPGSGTFVATTPGRFVDIRLRHNLTGGTDGKEYFVDWRQLAAYGDHGLPLIGETNPLGVAASDVVKFIVAKYCPQLRAGEGITPTTYPIGHLVFRDRVFPYDALLDVNKMHLFELAVWEGREVHWGPADLTDYDWEIRGDDPGVKIDPQGPTAEDLANGIEVEYDDVQTGRRELLLPDDHPELRDGDVENPVNQHGLQVHTSITLTSPATRDMALQFGRLVLAEHNEPKEPGSVTVEGWARDRAGEMQPSWKMRAGDRIAITSSTSLSDRPRLLGETNYAHDKRTLTAGVEGLLPRAEAFQDRLAVALRAAGIS